MARPALSERDSASSASLSTAQKSAPAKAAAAAAGWESASAISTVEPAKAPQAAADPAKVSGQTTFQERASAVAEVEPATEAPAFRVDPSMAESAKDAVKGPSFSEMTELPPLKEIYTPPPPPPPVEPEFDAEPPASLSPVHREKPEKPRVQPREVARKAVTEIKKTPPKLFLYSIAGAIAIMLLVVGFIAYRIHSENSADEGTAETPTAAAAPVEAAPKPGWNQAQPPVQAPVHAQPEQISAGRETPPVSVTPRYNKNNKKKAKVQTFAPTIIPGQMTINTTPEGAEVHVDGRTDPSWITPFNLPGLAPGQHSVTVARAGYSAETRTIEVASGS
jgi:hypothetical protein